MALTQLKRSKLQFVVSLRSFHNACRLQLRHVCSQVDRPFISQKAHQPRSRNKRHDCLRNQLIQALRQLKPELTATLGHHLMNANGDPTLLSLIRACKSENTQDWEQFIRRFDKCWTAQRRSWARHMSSKNKGETNEEIEAKHKCIFETEFNPLERTKAILAGYALALEKITNNTSVQGCSFVHKELTDYLLQLK